jgi:hypothetical protein
MKRSAASLSALVLASLVTVPAHAVQGTRVTSGGLTFSGGLGDIEIRGQSGFSMSARVDNVSGIFAPDNQCSDVDCVPGTQVSLNAHWTGNDLPGSASLRGQSYVLGSEGAGAANGIVTFDGSVVLPDFNSTGSVDVSAPFTFSGQLKPEDAPTAEPLFGSGIATLTFHQSADGSAWQFASATYEFRR